MDKTGILLERNLQPHHLPFLIGEKSGLTDERNLQLEVHEPLSVFSGFERLYEGEVQFMLTQPLYLLNEYLRGGNLTAVAQLMDSQGGVLYRTDSGLQEPADLKDANRILYRGIDEKIARQLLLSLDEELGPEDLAEPEFIRSSETGIDALAEGEADVLLPADIVPEGVALQQSGTAVDFWFFTHFSLPENGRLVLVVADETIDLAPNKIQEAVSFFHESIQYVKDNIPACQQFFRDNYSEELDQTGMEAVLQSGPGNLSLNFSQDFNLYTTWGEWIEDNLDIEGFVDLDRLIDERFIPIAGLEI